MYNKYNYSMEYYSAIKNNEISPFATKCSQLETILLSEISQPQKDKYHMFALIWDNLPRERKTKTKVNQHTLAISQIKNVMQPRIPGIKESQKKASLQLNKSRPPNETSKYIKTTECKFSTFVDASNIMTNIKSRKLESRLHLMECFTTKHSKQCRGEIINALLNTAFATFHGIYIFTFNLNSSKFFFLLISSVTHRSYSSIAFHRKVFNFLFRFFSDILVIQ